MFKHSLCLFLAFCASPALAGEEPLRPRLEGNARLGTERSIGMTEAWIPVWQQMNETGQAKRVVYGDLRLMADDQENQEGNLGLGYRSLTPSNDAVWGVHGWFDRRLSDNGGKFNQITIGGELFTPKYELRGNIYAPLSDAHEFITDSGRDPYLAGSQIFVDAVGRAIEQPLKGLDLELGYTLPAFTDTFDSVRVYGGGYHFYDDDAENVTGWRTRIAADITPDFQIGARFQRDDERGSQSFLEATIRFPLGMKSSFKKKGVRARLDESPERDVDIVTGNKVTTPGGAPTPAVNATTGAAQRVLYVDNTAAGGGDGTLENPYNTTLAAETVLQPYDIVYVALGDGTTTGYTTGFLLNQTGARLIGSGDDFVYDNGFLSAPSGSASNGAVLRTATSAPKITNVAGGGLKAGDGVAITASYVQISGIDIQNTNRHGIRSNAGFSDMVIENVNILSTAQYGIIMSDNSRVNISNVTITNAGARGIDIRTAAQNMSDLNLSNVTVTTPVNRGFSLSALAGFDIENVSISNLTITGAGSNGLEITSGGGSLFSGLDIDHLTVTNGAAEGLRIVSDAAGTRMDNVSVDHATLSGNSSNLTMGANNGGNIGQVELDNITATGSTAIGVHLSVGVTSVVDSVIFRNSSVGTSGSQGLRFTTSGSGVFSDVQIADTIVSGSTSFGLFLSGSGSSAIDNFLVRDSSFVSNSSYGVYISDASTGVYNVNFGEGTAGSPGGNRIFNNTGADIRVDMDGAELKAENNWWGVNTGLAVGERTLDAGSTIDAAPFLVTDPGP